MRKLSFPLRLAWKLVVALLLAAPFTRTPLAADAPVPLLTFFGNQITSVVAGYLRPMPASPSASETLANAQMVADLGRLSPITLFREMTQALLDPTVQSLDPYFTDPTRRAVATILPYGQSLLLIWPQVVLLVAGTVACFAAGYVAFMRQEIRA